MKVFIIYPNKKPTDIGRFGLYFEFILVKIKFWQYRQPMLEHILLSYYLP
ncbi:hypothetical protein [Moraxella phage Mcat29]|nr:hypothetical protein [Moraxella phage Mcat29]